MEYPSRKQLAYITGIIWAVVQLTTGFTTVPLGVLLPSHLMFALIICFLIYPFKSRWKSISAALDAILILVAIVINVWILMNHQRLISRSPLVDPLKPFEVYFGILALFLVLEANRRILGKIFTVLGLIALTYAVMGNRIPGGFFTHRGLSLYDLSDFLYLSTSGIYAIPLSVVSRYVYLFILMAAVLIKSGAIERFMSLSTSIAGHLKGGPAKVAVISSGLIGSINGSAVANVVTTGSVTIPLMKKVGYRSEDAGAVETLASTGGQILPPVMGAAAFIMAQLAGVSYKDVALAAVFPAILYYFGVYGVVHFIARRDNLRGLSKKELPKLSEEIKRSGHLFIPFIVIVLLLMKYPYAIMKVAFYAVISTYIIVMLKKETRLNIKGILESLWSGSEMTISATIPSALAGIILGVLLYSGLGRKFSTALVGIGGEQILLIAVMVAIVALILGMGMPTTGAYITAAIMAIPALIIAGVPKIIAHLFGLYFSVISMITPPICIAAYAASGIANSNPMRTGFRAFIFGIPVYIIPFLMLIHPDIVLGVGSFSIGFLYFLKAAVAILLFSSGVVGFLIKRLSIFERTTLIGGSILLLFSSLNSTLIIISIILISAGTLVQIIEYRKPSINQR
jgi:TRAP transporter 4TM/12TM fusion protein